MGGTVSTQISTQLLLKLGHNRGNYTMSLFSAPNSVLGFKHEVGVGGNI